MARMEHFALFADDLEALRDFYMGVMGMTLLLDNSKAPVAGYFLGDENGTSLEIIARPPGAESANQRYVCHIAFSVDDVPATRADLESKGFVFETDTVVDTDAFKTCFFRDPQGNRLQIVWRAKPLGS
jgi:glyoxylase I family protein